MKQGCLRHRVTQEALRENFTLANSVGMGSLLFSCCRQVDITGSPTVVLLWTLICDGYSSNWKEDVLEWR